MDDARMFELFAKHTGSASSTYGKREHHIDLCTGVVATFNYVKNGDNISPYDICYWNDDGTALGACPVLVNMFYKLEEIYARENDAFIASEF